MDDCVSEIWTLRHTLMALQVKVSGALPLVSLASSARASEPVERFLQQTIRHEIHRINILECTLTPSHFIEIMDRSRAMRVAQATGVTWTQRRWPGADGKAAPTMPTLVVHHVDELRPLVAAQPQVHGDALRTHPRQAMQAAHNLARSRRRYLAGAGESTQ